MKHFPRIFDSQSNQYLAPGVRVEQFLIFTLGLQAEAITSESVKHLKVRLLDLHHVPDVVGLLDLGLVVLHSPVAVHQELVVMFALPGVVYVDPVGFPLRFGHLDTSPARHGPRQIDVVCPGISAVPEDCGHLAGSAGHHVVGGSRSRPQPGALIAVRSVLQPPLRERGEGGRGARDAAAAGAAGRHGEVGGGWRGLWGGGRAGRQAGLDVDAGRRLESSRSVGEPRVPTELSESAGGHGHRPGRDVGRHHGGTIRVSPVAQWEAVVTRRHLVTHHLTSHLSGIRRTLC